MDFHGFPLIFQGKKAQVDGSKTAPTEGSLTDPWPTQMLPHEVLRSSTLLDIEGEGRQAMVRRKEDYSRRADETEDQAGFHY